MKLRLLTIALAAALPGCLASCNLRDKKLPPGSQISIGTGKNVVAVEAGGRTWGEVFKEAGQKALALGGRLAVDFAISYAESKLGPKADRGK